MLSRAGSDASSYLRRTKSATSVKQRRREQVNQQPIQAETARMHALAAAHVAMGRANERASIEMRRSTELARCDNNAGRSGNLTTTRPQTLNFSPASELRRQRSILQSKGSNIVSSSHQPGTYRCDHPSPHTASPSELGAIQKYGSEPSSYRKLRRAKSFLTPRKRAMSMHDMSTCSPSPTRTLQQVKSSLEDAEQGLKLGLRRSMSFLRGSSSNLSKGFKRAESQTKQHDSAIRLAQEHFFDDLQQQRLRKKTSLFSNKTRHQQKPFRKTVRSSRRTEFGDGVKSENQRMSSSTAESKSRSISASIRDKVKRVFGKSISKKDGFPAQQLDASRPYFREFLDVSGMESALDQYFVGDNDATARGSLYIPSVHDCDSLEDLDRMSTTLRSAQSMESLHSNSRSRVTSWTNSTITNSVTARGTPLERKRLSIIKEDGGPHQPSSSTKQHAGGINIFRKPLSSQNSTGNPAPVIDSQRIYSALKRRIDQEENDAESSPDQGDLIDGEANTLPSSAQSYQTAPTIRAVPSQASIRTIAPDSEHRQFSVGSPTWHEHSGMTPQELAQHNENVERRRARLAEQEQHSSFFPFSSRSKSQTPSPFKLALTARKENSGASQSESGSVVVNRLDGQTQGIVTMSSDSIYSRTTGGHTTLQNISADTSSQDADEPPPVDGTATIISANVARYPRPASNLVRLHRTRSSERRGWEGNWENQITSLGRCQPTTSTSHYREHAQLDADDTAIGVEVGKQKTTSGFGPGLSRHGWQHMVRSAKDRLETSIPLQGSSSVMNERFPLLELKEVPRKSIPKPTAHELTRASMIGMNDENQKLSDVDGPKRACSPLRGRGSQLSLRYKDQAENPPSVSTPGLQGSSQGCCKTPSVRNTEDLTPTPKQRAKSQMSLVNRAHFGQNITNEMDRYFHRLPKMSDIDSADWKGAFESEDLWIEPSYGTDGKAERLGVATLAGAGMPGYSGHDEGRETALPKIEKRSTNKEIRKMMSSKRMVSNFLRSRRKHTPVKDDAGGATSASSPVFV